MDKITRILLLYSKLIRGEPVNKAVFCIETDSNERSFDRDIEDIRLFLSEMFSVDELLYDRAKKCYYISGVTKKELELTEYRFLQRLLFQSGVLRRDELEGILHTLASNTTRYRECVQSINSNIEVYENPTIAPLLKMHEDISQMINDRQLIRIRYYDIDTVKEYDIIPYDIEIVDERLQLLSVYQVNDQMATKCFLIERIESFVPLSGLSGEKWSMAVNQAKRYFENDHIAKIKIVIECEDDFVEILHRRYAGFLQYEDCEGKSVVTIEDYDSSFVEWILGQDTGKYNIIEPEQIKNKIGTVVEALCKKYRKE